MEKFPYASLYRKSFDSSAQARLLDHFGFNAAAWLVEFNRASAAVDRDAIRYLRILVQEGTLKYCRALAYPYGASSDRVKLCNGISVVATQAANTKLNNFRDQYEFTVSNIDADTYETVIEVKNADCLDEGIRLKELGCNPAVLNMASAKRAGGGYNNGAGAQEENLFRRTNLFQVLEDLDHLHPNRKWHYPLPEFSSVYSPSVFVIRSSEQTGYAFLKEPVELAFIAVAAYAHPQTIKTRSGALMLADKFIDKTMRKMRGLLWTALVNNHDSIVLSALGCGAYKNPPLHIARLFKKVLEEPSFRGKFKHIVFAIFDDHNAHKEHNPEGNVKPFVDTFSTSMKGAIFVLEGALPKYLQNTTSEEPANTSADRVTKVDNLETETVN